MISEEGYEKDKNEAIIKLSVALQQIMIGYPDIALECAEKTRRILLKYGGITEEQRKQIQGKDENESGRS